MRRAFWPRWIRAAFAWKTVRMMGVYAYQQNMVTGARRAIRLTHGCHGPRDQGWVDTGEWASAIRPPPPAPLRPQTRECFAIAHLHEGVQENGIRYSTRAAAEYQSRLSRPYGFKPLYLVRCREKPHGAPKRYA